MREWQGPECGSQAQILLDRTYIPSHLTNKCFELLLNNRLDL